VIVFGEAAPAVAALRLTTARLAAIFHVTTWVLAATVGVAVVGPSRVWFVGFVIGLTAWTVVFWVAASRAGLVLPLVAGDAVVTGVTCLIIGRLVRPEAMGVGGVWLAPMTAGTLLTIAFALSPFTAVLLGVAIAGCTAGGALLAGHAAAGAGTALTCLIQIGAMSTMMVQVRRSSRTADEVFAAEQRQRWRAQIEQARRADERAQLRTIHGTALATLTMIGAGAVSGSPAAVRRWAAADLSALRSMRSGERAVRTRLDERLLEVVARHGDQVRIVFDLVPCWTSPDVVDAMSEAVAEAVANAARHSGADEVRLTLCQSDGVLTVRIADHGRGFEMAQVPEHRYGVRQSIINGVEAVGGAARLEKLPGAGCVWTLTWPVLPVSAESSTRVAAHLETGAVRAAFAIAAFWHLTNDVIGVVTSWQAYRRPYGAEVSAGLWVVFTAVGVLAALRWSGRGARGRWFPPCAVAVLMAGVVVNVIICAGPGLDTAGLAFTSADWAIGVSGWIGVLVLWRSRMVWLVVLFAVNPLIELATLWAVAPLTGLDGARWISATYGITMLQVVLVLGARFLRRHGDRVALSAQRQNRDHADRQAANAVHEDRRRRYEQVGDAVGRLLEDIAVGRACPDDAATRHRASVEAARLRRLIAERDDVADPLTHELRAAADVAERRGVQVELVMFGKVPPLSVDERRGLIDGPARLLAVARSWARITVAASADEVSVGVVVDGVLAQQELAEPAAYQIDEDGQRIWLEAICRK
jgi:hypothetical protein